MARNDSGDKSRDVVAEAGKKIPRFTRKQALFLVLFAMVLAGACYLVPMLANNGNEKGPSLRKTTSPTTVTNEGNAVGAAAESNTGNSFAPSVSAGSGSTVVNATEGASVVVNKDNSEELQKERERLELQRKEEEQKKEEERRKEAERKSCSVSAEVAHRGS